MLLLFPSVQPLRLGAVQGAAAGEIDWTRPGLREENGSNMTYNHRDDEVLPGKGISKVFQIKSGRETLRAQRCALEKK